jgi:hypothetical protein
MPKFESIPPSKAVENGRFKLETLQMLLEGLAKQPPCATQSQVNFAKGEAEKSILPLEEELGLQRDESGIRHYTALDQSLHSRRTLALVNDLYNATGKIRA